MRQECTMLPQEDPSNVKSGFVLYKKMGLPRRWQTHPDLGTGMGSWMDDMRASQSPEQPCHAGEFLVGEMAECAEAQAASQSPDGQGLRQVHMSHRSHGQQRAET